MTRFLILSALVLSTAAVSVGCTRSTADPSAASQNGDNGSELATLRKELSTARIKLSVVEKKIGDSRLPNLQQALKRLRADLQTEIKRLEDQIQKASQAVDQQSAS